jgi:hypothetical protein
MPLKAANAQTIADKDLRGEGAAPTLKIALLVFDKAFVLNWDLTPFQL